MTLYQTATMLAGQFFLVLMHNTAVRRGSIEVIPLGDLRGIYIHPDDAA